jgi:hypothetical protein
MGGVVEGCLWLMVLVLTLLQPFYKIWNMIYDFKTSRKEWLLGPFLELQGNKIEDEVRLGNNTHAARWTPRMT